MADCELLAKCPFFNDQMKGLDAIKDMLKRRYCQGDKKKCARYMVLEKLGRENVPADLAPNQQDRARKIILDNS